MQSAKESQGLLAEMQIPILRRSRVGPKGLHF